MSPVLVAVDTKAAWAHYERALAVEDEAVGLMSRYAEAYLDDLDAGRPASHWLSTMREQRVVVDGSRAATDVARAAHSAAITAPRRVHLGPAAEDYLLEWVTA